MGHFILNRASKSLRVNADLSFWRPMQNLAGWFARLTYISHHDVIGPIRNCESFRWIKALRGADASPAILNQAALLKNAGEAPQNRAGRFYAGVLPRYLAFL